MTPNSAAPGSEIWLAGRSVFRELDGALTTCRNELAIMIENRAFVEADQMRARIARINSLQLGIAQAVLLARRDMAGARAAIERIREDAAEIGA